MVSFIDHFLLYLRSRGWATPASSRDIDGYSMTEWLGTTAQQCQLLMDEFQHDRGMSLRPAPGAQAAIEYLSTRWDLVAITARPYLVQDITRALVNKCFGATISNIIHVGMSTDLVIPKWQIAHALGVQILIDDSLSNAKEAAAHGMRALLMDRGFGWNQCESLPAGVYRIRSWGQAVRHLQRWAHPPCPTFRLAAAATG